MIALATLFAIATTVPFDLVDNRVLVPIVVNGKGPYRVLLDTGAPGLTLRDEIADELSLPRFEIIEANGTGEAKVQGFSSRVQSVAIGGHDLGPMSCGILPFTDAPNDWGSERFDGILGLPVFSRWAVTIDYTRKQLILADQVHAAPGAIRVPLSLPSHIPMVTATVLGFKGHFGIDTGARSSLLLTGRFVKRHRLVEKLKVTKSMITGWGIGGPVRSRLARLTRFRLGGVTFKSIVVRLSTQSAGALATGDFDGLIGPGVLEQFVVTFDYRHRVMLLVENDRYGAPDRWDGTGMWLGQNGGAFEVLDVLAGSPAAAAGLRIGDRIVAIDGRPVTGLSLPAERLRLYYDGHERSVKLRMSDGREIAIELRAIV